MAPEVISQAGKMSILFVYALLVALATYGASEIKTLFGFDLVVTPEFTSYDYIA